MICCHSAPATFVEIFQHSKLSPLLTAPRTFALAGPSARNDLDKDLMSAPSYSVFSSNIISHRPLWSPSPGLTLELPSIDFITLPCFVLFIAPPVIITLIYWFASLLHITCVSLREQRPWQFCFQRQPQGPEQYPAHSSAQEIFADWINKWTNHHHLTLNLFIKSNRNQSSSFPIKNRLSFHL